MASEEEERCGKDELWGAEAFVGVLGEAVPHLRCAAIHAAVEGVGGVEEVGREAVRAKGARECDGVVDAVGDGAVAADSVVGFAADGEDLATRGGEARVGGFAHALQREEAEQDEVDQRDD